MPDRVRVLVMLATLATPHLAPHVCAQQAIDEAQLGDAEEVMRAWLDFLIEAQHEGALTTSVIYDPATGTVAPLTQVTNDDSAVPLGHPFLWGHRIWGDDRYLKATCDLADFYAKAQFPEGGWAYSFTLQADGGVQPVWRIANFEEWVQSNGIRQLAAAYQLTGDAKYRQTAAKAGEVIVGAQDAAGWWPWGAAIGPEDDRADYMKGPTLNDWNLNACMGDCLVLYHLTGDERYRDALFRAGKWLIKAQMEGPTPGWAAQYDTGNQPIWARFMEPPAADTVFGTYGAGSGLMMLYDITGDDRYLAPLRPHLAWLQSIPQEQKGWMWYAHRSWMSVENKGTVSDYTRRLTEQYGGTLPSEEALSGIAIEAGEPIIAYHYQMVPVDHPEMDCYLKPLNGHYGSRSERVQEWLAVELAKRADGPVIDAWNGTVPAAQAATARPSREACAEACNLASVAELVDQFRQWRTGEEVRGFVESAEGGLKVNLSRGCSNASRILEQIALAHVGVGKAPPEIIPMYRPVAYAGNFPLVDPARDWYDVGVR